MPKNRLKNWLMHVLALTLLFVGPFVTPIDAITAGDIQLQVQLVLGTDGVPITGPKDVIIRLKRSGNVVMWEKTYSNQALPEGVLNVALSGNDDQERALSVSMFDAADVVLAVEVDLNEVELSMVSQPYAIKARVSDDAHSARGLQGVPVTAVNDINNGDILVYRDGSWVPTGEGDGYTGITGQLERATSIEGLSDVSLDGVNDGDILRFNGLRWVNDEDRVLSADQVDEIVGDQGYIKEVSISALERGAYDQITGIGGKISVDPTIQLNDSVVINGGLAVNSIGNGFVPVP